jgi:hypothetical protein
VLGGSLSRADSGYLATIQTTGGIHPSPMMVRDLWPTVRSKRSPEAWNDREPDGELVIYWTPRSTTIVCGECGKSLGKYRAYQAGRESGIVSDTPRRYHPPGRHAAGTLELMPQDREQGEPPVFWITGDIGFRSAKSFAHFRCTVCRIEFEENLRRLGLNLFEAMPKTYQVTAVIRRERR